MLKKTLLKNRTFVLLAFLFAASLRLSYADDDSFTVNAPNAQGGYTAIVIKRSGDGYLGPQGEYYPHFPSVSQLQVMYGLGSAPPVNVPVSAVQPEVQPDVQPVMQPEVQEPVTYQVIEQPAYQEIRGDHYDQPVLRQYPGEMEPRRSHKEDEDVINIFDFKKKKKSKEPQKEEHKPAEPVKHGPENKPPMPSSTKQPVESKKPADGKDKKSLDLQTKPAAAS